MAYFVIAGKPNCTNYIHACHVGKYLQERLPNFNLQTIEKISGDWEVSFKNFTLLQEVLVFKKHTYTCLRILYAVLDMVREHKSKLWMAPHTITHYL